MNRGKLIFKLLRIWAIRQPPLFESVKNILFLMIADSPIANTNLTSRSGSISELYLSQVCLQPERDAMVGLTKKEMYPYRYVASVA